MFIRKIIDIVGNAKKSFAWYMLLVYDLEFTTPCCLRPRVYYTLTNFRGGGPPSIRQCIFMSEMCGFHSNGIFIID